MALTNAQYDEIMRGYEQRQTENRHRKKTAAYDLRTRRGLDFGREKHAADLLLRVRKKGRRRCEYRLYLGAVKTVSVSSSGRVGRNRFLVRQRGTT